MAADSIETGHGDVVVDRQCNRQARALPVLGNQRDTGPDSVAGSVHLQLFPAEVHTAGIDRVESKDGAAEFRTAGADQPTHADDFARTKMEGNVLQDAASREILDAQ